MDNAVSNNGDRSILPPGLTSAVYALIMTFIIFGASFSQSQAKSAVDFYKEEISMIVDNGEFSIIGVYYFRNNTDSDKPMPIVFPFYIDDSTHFPHKIKVSVAEGEEERPLDFQEIRERGSIRLAIPMTPRETTVWHIEYTQKIDKPQATYVLKSTQVWGQPLKEARYKIDIPDNIDIDYIWADVDSVTDAESREILWIHKTEYMPFKDMTIKWKQR